MSATLSPADIGLPEAPPEPSRPAGAAGHARVRADAQLRALLTHHDGTTAGSDPEELHKFRVAVRRLRSLLKSWPVFGTGGDDMAAELRWLGGVTSPVRDLDVLLARLREDVADFGGDDRAAAATLIAALTEERDRYQDELRDALASKRYRKLLTGLAALATSAEVTQPATELQPGTALIGSLRKPYRKLARAVDTLGYEPGDDDLHALRIHGKKLRYAAETALASAENSEVKHLKDVMKACRELQNVLGEHQDAVVAAERLRALGTAQTDPRVAMVAGRIVERGLARRAAVRARWPAVWRVIADAAAPLV